MNQSNNWKVRTGDQELSSDPHRVDKFSPEVEALLHKPKETVKPSPSIASTGSREYATRSADSATLRKFTSQEAQGNTQPVSVEGRRNFRYSASKGLQGYFKSAGLSSERDRQSAKAFLKEESDKAEAEFKAVEDAFKATANALAEEQRNAVASGIDPLFELSLGDRQNLEAAKDFALQENEEALDMLNQNVWDNFHEFGSHHDFMRSEKDYAAIKGYVERNLKAHGIKEVVYCPFSVLVRAFARLEMYSLLDTPAHIFIAPERAKENYFEAEERRHREKAEQEAEIASRTGIDPLTGGSRVYTKTEIRRMSGDDFKKAQIGGTVLPTFTDVFSAPEQR